MKIKLKYVMRKVTIDKSSISKFIINLRDRRAVRGGKVNDLIKLCKSGEHFSSPFVVNESNNKMRVIDGNHRYEAIIQCIKEDPNFKIDIWIAVYKDLNLAQERDVFTTWNKGTVQSSTDFLKMHYDTIPMGKKILQSLPTTIYGNKITIKIVNLMGGQINAKKHRKFEGGYSAPKENTVFDFQQLTPEDIQEVSTFVDFMDSVFGKFHSVNNKQFYQTTPLFAFYRIWYDNRHNNATKLEKIFKKVFVNQAKSWEEFTKSGGRSACQTFYRTVIATLKGISNSSILIFDDNEAIEKYEQENKIINLVKTV